MRDTIQELRRNLMQTIEKTEYPIIIEDTNSPCKIWLNYESPEYGAIGAITILECERFCNCSVSIIVDEAKEKIFMKFPMIPNDSRPCAVLMAKEKGISVELQIDE